MARTSRKYGQAPKTPTAREIRYNTALYLRLSVLDSGKKDGDSIHNQRALLERYIAIRPEFELKNVFVDNGETGVDFSRPAWNELLNECRAGRINCIIVKDLSRIGRNYIETGELLEKTFPLLGVRLIAPGDSYDSQNITAGGQLTANLKNLVNDIYAKDISRKTSAAFSTKQKNGAFIGSYAAYGYLKSGKNAIVVDPETAPIVRQIFKWKSEGSGNAQICRKLNDAGILAPNHYRLTKGIVKCERYKSCVWMPRTIHEILRNPVCLGHMVQGKRRVSICEGIDRRTKPHEWVTVKNTHEPIISQEIFDEVQALTAQRSVRAKSIRGNYAHIKSPELRLKGLVYCGDCRKLLVRRKSVTGGGKYCEWLYCCRTHEELKACSRKQLRQQDLYNAVYDAIHIQMQMCADITAAISKLNCEHSHASRLSHFDLEIEESEREIKRIASFRQSVFENYSAKLLTASEYKFAIEKYDADIKKQAQRIDASRREKSAYTQKTTPANKWITAISQFMDAKELTSEMAQMLVERVDVSNYDNVAITFKFRDEFAEVKQCTQ